MQASLEAQLENGLGLQKTKTGAGDKERAYLIKRKRAIKIATACIIVIGFFFVCIIYSREAVDKQKGKAIKAQQGMRSKEHQSAINMATMGAELEAHLLEESKEEDIERQFMFEEQDFESDLKKRLSTGLSSAFADFEKKMNADKFVSQSKDAAGKQALIDTIHKQNTQMSDIVLQEIKKFRSRMEALSKTHLEVAATESKKARIRLKQLHQTIKESISQEVRNAASGTAGAAQTQPEDKALDKKLLTFFERVAAYQKASPVQLPPAVAAELQAIAKDVKAGKSPHELEERAVKALTGTTGAAAGSVVPYLYGAPRFRHGDFLPKYIEGVLFAHTFRASGAARLQTLRAQWAAKKLGAMELMQTLMDLVVSEGYPAEWLNDGEESLGPPPDRDGHDPAHGGP